MARSNRRTLVAAGAAAMLPGAALMVLALWLHHPSLALFLIGGLLLGVGAGALFKGAVVTVIAIAEAHHRAEALAGLFLGSYVGLALPAVGLGVLTQHVQPKVALLVFAGLVAIGMLASVGPLLKAGDQRAPLSA
jgi:MFS family permease